MLQHGPELLRSGSLPRRPHLPCSGGLPRRSELLRSGHLLPGRLLRRILLPAQTPVLHREFLLETVELRKTEKPLDHGPHGHGHGLEQLGLHGLVSPYDPGHPLADR